MTAPFAPLSDYDVDRRAVEAAGYFTSPELLDGNVDRVVCASKRDEFGYTGVSFWIAKRGDAWYVGSWGGSIYRIPPDLKAGLLAIDILATHQGTPRDFNLELKLKHSLREVSGKELYPNWEE